MRERGCRLIGAGNELLRIHDVLLHRISSHLHARGRLYAFRHSMRYLHFLEYMLFSCDLSPGRPTHASLAVSVQTGNTSERDGRFNLHVNPPSQTRQGYRPGAI